MKLKDCPFCGGEAEIEQVSRKGMRVKCKKCHMGLKQSVLRFSLEWLEKNLAEAWNRRSSK